MTAKLTPLTICPLSKPAAELVQVCALLPQLVTFTRVLRATDRVAGVKTLSVIPSGLGLAGQLADDGELATGLVVALFVAPGLVRAGLAAGFAVASAVAARVADSTGAGALRRLVALVLVALVVGAGAAGAVPGTLADGLAVPEAVALPSGSRLLGPDADADAVGSEDELACGLTVLPPQPVRASDEAARTTSARFMARPYDGPTCPPGTHGPTRPAGTNRPRGQPLRHSGQGCAPVTGTLPLPAHSRYGRAADATVSPAPSDARSTTTSSPSRISPASSALASSLPIALCTRRRSGRAP